MKRRNMEIVRELLIDVSKGVETLEYDPNTQTGEIDIYHIELLEQIGYIKYDKKFQDMIPMFYIDNPRLTWEGNDYLDAINNETIWNKIKEVIKKKGLEIGDVPFSVILELSRKQVKNIIGLE